MRSWRYFLAVLALAGAWSLMTDTARAAVTPEQKAAAKEIQDLLREANRQIRVKDLDAATKTLSTARDELKKLAASGDERETRGLAAPLEKRLAGMEKLLGEKLGRSGMPAGPSFSKEVAPILLARCGACHVRRTRGGLSMSSYAAIGQGADGSPVVVAGDSESSRLVESIRSGDMPRGGGRVPSEELATLEAWIKGGARFDGDNPNTPLDRLVPAGSAMPAMTDALMVARPKGNETVLFSRDIAPVLVAQCIGCHGGNQASANLNLDDFNSLLRGGNTGALLVPGKADESLLIQKLRAPERERMPLRRPALPEETIARFVTWINEGATFDGLDPRRPTDEIAEIYRTSQMSHEELSAERVDYARKKWHLAIPDEKPAQHETPQFLFVGDRPAAELAPLADLAEASATRFAKYVNLPTGEPLIRGRLTFFVLARRFDYGEFAQMVEGREAEATEDAHWRYDILDAYSCLVLPREADPARASGLLTRELIGAYLEHLAEVPAWFARGSALALAAQLEPRGADRAALDEAARAARAKLTNPQAFLTGNVVPAEVDPLSYGFVKFLLTSPERYRALLASLRGGQKFDEALKQHYGRDAEALVKLWPR
ncbi:MAG: hypothetical protein KF708_12030 [Pirellulales bacterium]|nr:hypothetical protein [Pirellulales bacterium]